MTKKFLGKLVAGAALGGVSLLITTPSLVLAADGSADHHDGGHGYVLTRPRYVKPGHELTIIEVCKKPQKHAWVWSEVTGKVELKPKHVKTKEEHHADGMAAIDGVAWNGDDAGSDPGTDDDRAAWDDDPAATDPGGTATDTGTDPSDADSTTADSETDAADADADGTGPNTGTDDDRAAWDDDPAATDPDGTATDTGTDPSDADSTTADSETEAADADADGTGPDTGDAGDTSDTEETHRTDGHTGDEQAEGEDNTDETTGMEGTNGADESDRAEKKPESDGSDNQDGSDGKQHEDHFVYWAKVKIPYHAQPSRYKLKGSCGHGKLVIAPVGAVDGGDGGTGTDTRLALSGAGMLGAAALGGIVLLRRRRSDATLA